MASNRQANPGMTGLGYYVSETLFENFRKNKADIEKKYQSNLDAFNRISEGKWKKDEAEGWRSDTFIGVTKSHVISAFSIIIDMELQGGEIPFMLKPSPWDDVVYDELPEEQKTELEKNIEDMRSLIRQQLKDSNADRQFMKNILSCTIYGETYAKKYVHEVKRKSYQKTNFLPEGMPPDNRYMRFEEKTEKRTSPAWGYVSVWNIFRDLEVESLQDGAGVIERTMISPYELRQKIGKPYYTEDAIEKAIKEAENYEGGSNSSNNNSTAGEDTETLPPALRNIPHRNKTIRLLEAWVRVPKRIAEEFESRLKENKGYEAGNFEWEMFDRDGNEVEILCEMANDEVIRYARNESGERPYERSVFEDNLDGNHGLGVADNLKDMQRMTNGAVRAFEDNKKLSGNVILAVKERYFDSDDFKTKPGEKVPISDDCDDVRKAIQPVIIPDIGETLLSAINLSEHFAENDSLIPKISQGLSINQNKPDTAYEFSQQIEKSGKYLGMVIRNQDEGLIEPMINAFYRYNMEDPDVQKGKGNYICEALGFTSFQDRVVRMSKIQQLLQLALSSEMVAAETKIRHLIEEFTKSLDLDPDQTLKSPEEKQKEAEERAAAEQNNPALKLQMALQQIELMLKQADATEKQTQAELNKASAEAKRFGMVLDQEEMKRLRAESVQRLNALMNDMRMSAADSKRKNAETVHKLTTGAKEQGPYREKGMRSNNEGV